MRVLTGLDRLLSTEMHLLKGKKVGIVTHPAAVTSDLTLIVDALVEAGVNLTAIFGPEHGFRGTAADGLAVGNSLDHQTGLPVYSLYGDTKEPTSEMLENVDVLLFDMQDVGVRFYTFLSTLFYILKGAGKAGKQVLLLDRPNPLNGELIEGPSIEPGLESFVGIVPMPVRHGLTLGELACLMNNEHHLGAELTVLPMLGWKRSMVFEQTGLPWVITSPGMPHLDTVKVYPGTCLIEGTNLSEGRGTTLPFEMVGAPWLQAEKLANTLNKLSLPGIRFRATYFEPTWGKNAKQQNAGVQLHLTQQSVYRPLAAGLFLLKAMQAQNPDKFEFLSSSWEGHPPHFDLLMGNAQTRMLFLDDVPVMDLVNSWRPEEDQFAQLRQKYLLYE